MFYYVDMLLGQSLFKMSNIPLSIYSIPILNRKGNTLVVLQGDNKKSNFTYCVLVCIAKDYLSSSGMTSLTVFAAITTFHHLSLSWTVFLQSLTQ